MTTERQIMIAVVRADMILMSAWKYMLALLVILGLVLLVVLKLKQR